MTTEYCPQCGVARMGSFRFCRSCQFDFDSAPSIDSVDRVSTTPDLPTPAPPDPRPVTATVATPVVATGPAIRSRSRFSRRQVVGAAVVGLLVVGALGNAAGSPGATTPSGSPGSSMVAADPTLGPTPERTANPTPLPTPEPTPEPTPTPKPTPKPTPTPTPAPITFAKLTAREWKQVVKTPDNYIGDGFEVWGCISQFDAATGDDAFRAQAFNTKTEYWWSDGDNALFYGSASKLAEFVQDDVVFMKVVSLGSFSYDTQIGGNTTVPWFEIKQISHKGSCE